VREWTVANAHSVHSVSLGVVFVWLGALKQFGHETATSLLAHTVYWGDPETMVRFLGAWEVAIGVGLLVPRLQRVAVALLIVRLPGTLLALVLQPEVTFVAAPLAPSPEGQYLIKDLALFGAALVIAESGLRRRRHLPSSLPSR
jgi:uncharacterized membrane protein YkgB